MVPYCSRKGVHSRMYNEIMLQGYLTTKQASEKSGIFRDHIRRLMETGKLEGMRVVRDWLVQSSSLDFYTLNRPKPGPRRKTSASNSSKEVVCARTPSNSDWKPAMPLSE